MRSRAGSVAHSRPRWPLAHASRDSRGGLASALGGAKCDAPGRLRESSTPIPSDSLTHVLRNGRHAPIDFRHRVVDLRRQPDAGPVGPSSRRTADAIAAVKGGRELTTEPAARHRPDGVRQSTPGRASATVVRSLCGRSWSGRRSLRRSRSWPARPAVPHQVRLLRLLGGPAGVTEPARHRLATPGCGPEVDVRASSARSCNQTRGAFLR